MKDKLRGLRIPRPDRRRYGEYGSTGGAARSLHDSAAPEVEPEWSAAASLRQSDVFVELGAAAPISTSRPSSNLVPTPP